MKDRSDEQLLEVLAKAELDIPEGLPLEIVSRGERMVKPLCSLLTNDDDTWASTHALHLLGEIGSDTATPYILDWFRTKPGTDFVTEVGDSVLGRFGPNAVDPILEYLRDPGSGVILRGVAAKGLVQIGYRHPDIRPSIADKIVELLKDLSPNEDPELVAWLVSAFASIGDEAVRAEIDSAFERGEVWEGIINKNDVERIRLNDGSWWSYGIDEDLMSYFSPENLAYLARINSGGEMGMNWASSTGKASQNTKKKQNNKKQKRKQAKKSRRKNRK